MSVFKNIRQLIELYKNIDLEQLSAMNKKVDLAATMKQLSKLDEKQLNGLMKMLDSSGKKRESPPINPDFYELSDKLTPEQRALQLKVRNFMETEVAPMVNEFWLRDEFPHELIPKFGELGLAGVTYEGYGCPNLPFLMEGVLAMEMARIDASIATFFGVQSGLTMGSIYMCGSEEQKQEWLPAMNRFEKIGAFGLTEPEVGSGAAGGLTTTCLKTEDGWVLNGEKKWIGNATFADVVVIWARDLGDGEVKGFLVRKENPGFEVKKIKGKMALRIVQNGLITLKDCVVEEKDRLPHVNSFKDTANVLRMTRAGVAWMAVGCARGAYENALEYTLNRKQFGKPIASFQLQQKKLAEFLTEITKAQLLCLQLGSLKNDGKATPAQISMAKRNNMRIAIDIARESRQILGGMGIMGEFPMMRHAANLESVITYEGTHDVHLLITGADITGINAF